MTSSQSICAKAIRKDLRENFSDTKFSVTSSTFGHSNGVQIKWYSYHPTREEVWAVVGKYQRYQGKDVLDNTKWNYRDDIPQVDYVSLDNNS